MSPRSNFRVAAIILCVARLSTPVWGQWTGGPTGPIFYNGGNVGIGTPSPVSNLEIPGSTTNSSAKFGSLETQSYSINNDWIADNMYYNSSAGGWIYRNSGFGFVLHFSGGNLRFQPFASSTAGALGTQNTVMIVTNSGNVGIGTEAPQYKLAVNGTIGAKEVIVINTGWADYVFKPSFRLRPLKEVDAYIKQHHRLPEIPSETEVQESGVGLGEMQVKLLAKIEELTLHMIKADERNNRLEQQDRELQERTERLETRLVNAGVR